jgi:acyl CoA:acetate/3-ketoacid CoA transferase
MATAAAVTVVEADRIVPKGAIDPDDVHLPGLYVKRIVVVSEHRDVIEHRKIRVTGTPRVVSDAERTRPGRA